MVVGAGALIHSRRAGIIAATIRGFTALINKERREKIRKELAGVCPGCVTGS